VRAVLAESFERIHRSNLVGMGILPLEFMPGESVDSLDLSGGEVFTIDIPQCLAARQVIEVRCVDNSGCSKSFRMQSRIDTPVEIEYFRDGGILRTVLKKLASE
jgi:aconitate hydratase